MAELNYVGYDKLLQHVTEELHPRAQDSPVISPPYPLFHINGPVGSGRRTFIQRLWTQLAAGETPRILFTLNQSDEKSAAEQLLDGAVTNRSYLDTVITRIGAEIDGQAKRLEEAGRPLPPEARLTLWSDLVEQRLLDDPRNNRGLQIIFALPDLLALPQAQREAIAQEIPRSNANVDCRILVTGTSAAQQEELTKLFPERTPVDDVQLTALTLEEVEQWLFVKQVPAEFAADIYKRCGGLPGKLEEATATVVRERQERMMIIMAEEALSGVPDADKQYLCLAAMLPEINQRSLQVIMSEAHAASAMQILRRRDWPDSGWKEDRFVAGPQIRQALIKYLEKKYNDAYRTAVSLAEQFSRIHAIIPSGKHRDTLTRLSIFNYFNEGLLREIMPELAEEIIPIVTGNPSYFENTGSNYKLKPAVTQAVEAYVKLAKITIPEGDRKKISTAWEARRRKIMDLMATGEDKIKRESDTLVAVQGQIKQISDSIDNELNRINRIRRKSQRKAEKASKPSSGSGNGMQIGRLAMQGLGFVIIYLSFLFYSRSSLIYAAVGIGMIVGGLFVKGGVLAPANAPAQSNNAPPDDLDKHEKNLHFLNIKRGQLESRQNIVAMSIAKERSSLKEFDKQLREPYS